MYFCSMKIISNFISKLLKYTSSVSYLFCPDSCACTDFCKRNLLGFKRANSEKNLVCSQNTEQVFLKKEENIC